MNEVDRSLALLASATPRDMPQRSADRVHRIARGAFEEARVSRRARDLVARYAVPALLALATYAYVDAAFALFR